MPAFREIVELATIGFNHAVTLFLPRLVLAAILGGLIGLERESKHKPAGLRTNMFIGFGAAMFTVLSEQMQIGHTGDITRIAAQIIPGIGFIGAGSILHARGYVSGLTTAATLFVVASVGMAAGAGLYITATFSTLVVLVSLYLLGQLEDRFNLKLLTHTFEVTGPNPDEMQAEVTTILESEHRLMNNVHIAKTHTYYRLQFSVEGTNTEQQRILSNLKDSKLLEKATFVGPSEIEAE
jgi:putative Mg2+ transporter-C (MgtC) family protein